MAKSGKWAVVNGQSTVKNWTVNDANAQNAFKASNTAGGTFRAKGVHSWSGSFTQNLAIPSVMPGEIFSFAGFTAPTSGDLESSDGLCYTGQAIVDSVVITWNWVTNEPVFTVVNFSGHLALTQVEDNYLDATVPEIVSPSAAGAAKHSVVSGNFAGATAVSAVTQQVLTITAANQSYVDSSTVVSGVTWTGFEPGPIDWTLALTQNSNDRTTFVKDAIKKLYLPTSALEYYTLAYGKVGDFTGITADRDSGAIIQQTINFGMHSHSADDGTGAIGAIRLPGASTDWWPAAA